ncbi:MAG: T9SS type A sorting domain-containing protein [Bacteroidota bacterium]
MKQLTLLLFLSISFTLLGQDEPCDAISLNCNTPPLIGEMIGLSLNPDLDPNCQNNATGTQDIWFSFEADGENGYLFYSDQLGQSDHLLAFYTGPSCDDLTQLRECTNREAIHGAFPEGTYYVLVREKFNNGTDSGYSAGLLCSPIPANDDPCNAVEAICGTQYTGSLIGSSVTENTACQPAFADRDGGNVWFSIETDSSSVYNIKGKLGQDVALYQTDDCSGALQLVSSSCGFPDIYGFVGEGTYFVSVSADQYITRSALNYELRIDCGPMPENGLVTNPTELECSTGTISANAEFAPADDRRCDTGTSLRQSLWYSYESEFDGFFEISACGFYLQTFRENSDGLICLQQGTVCSSNPISLGVTTGEKYLFRVEASGNFDLVYSCLPSDFCPNLGFIGFSCDDGDPTTRDDIITSDCQCIGNPIPPGTLCQNAITIQENPFSIDYYNPVDEDFPPFFHSINDIPPYLDSLGSGPQTQGCHAAKDVVFSFTPEVDKYVDITASITDSNVELNITILTGCPFTVAHVSEGCGTPNFFEKKIENFHALADTTYYILIDGQPQLTGFDFNVDGTIEVVQKTFCSELDAFQFDSCNDGDPLTSNDRINENCECKGEQANEADFCETALNITPTAGLTVDPFSVNEEGNGYLAVYSGVEQCAGNNNQRDTWFKFEALSSTMIIGARGKVNYNPVIEVFDSCGGERLACKNSSEDEGGREIVVLDECIVGQIYYFRVYQKNSFGNRFDVAVSFFPSTQLDLANCESTALTLSDNVMAIVPEFEYTINRWYYQFNELEAPFHTYESTVIGQNPWLGLNQLSGLEEGRSYAVRVRGGIRGGQLQGDFGEACTISIIEASGIGQEGGNNVASNYAALKLELYPNPANGQEVSLSFTNLTGTEEQVVVRVFDMVGREILTQQYISSSKSTVFALGIEELSRGLYTVSASVNGSSSSLKLMVE